MTDSTPQQARLSDAEDRQWASFAHFGGVLWIVPCLVIFLAFRGRGALTRAESVTVLNWQITWVIPYVVSIVIGAGTAPLGLSLTYLVIFTTVIPWLLYLLNLVLSIVGGIRVAGGASFRYPVSVRFIR